MPLDSVATLVRLLQKHRLLEPSQEEELARTLAAQFDDPRGLAKELLKRSWLTPYQINQLFQNRASDLVFDNFILLERLGEGGMGQVFKARNRNLGQVVALKIIRRDLKTGPDSIRRFKREIETVSQLVHVNVVRAIDAGEMGGAHFLVMEYVEGTDLARLVKQSGPLTAPLAADYIRQAALGLQHAHERGLIHRDIKPANLLLTKQGVVKLADMGLARRQSVEQETALTREGSILGTPDYIAPEQARNSSGADIRSDLYSLGCTYYFLLAGEPPFPGGALTEKLLRHQLDAPPSVCQARPDVPADADAVIQNLMAKRPEERLQTPGELAAVLAGKAPLPKPATSSPRPAGRPQSVSGARKPSGLQVPVAAPVQSDSGTVPVATPVIDDPFSDLDTPVPVSVTRIEPPLQQPTAKRPWWLLGAAAAAVVLVVGLAAVGVQIVRSFTQPKPADDMAVLSKDKEAPTQDKDKAKAVSKVVVDPWNAAKEITKIKGGRVAPNPTNYVPDYQPTSVDLSGTTVKDNQLVHLTAMPQLTSLNLANTKITDKGLVHLKGLTKLTTIVLSGTAVTDAGLAHLKELPELQDINLSNTKQVHGPGLAYLQHIKKLKALNLSYSELNEADLGALAALPQLEQLQLIGDKQITDAALVHLKGLTRITSLSLSSTSVTDVGLTQLQDLTQLTYLDLANLKVTDNGLSKFKSLAQLKELNGAHTNLGNRNLAPLARAPNLQSAILAGTKIQDASLAALVGKAELHTVNLASTRISDAGLKQLATLPKLRSLELEQTNVTDAAFANLQTLKELQTLGLGKTGVKGHGLKQLASLNKLASLTLADTPLDDAGLEELSNLTQVSTLSLANCRGISDKGLFYVAEMKSLKSLTLSGAKVGDKGLSELKDVKDLATLYLTDTPGIAPESVVELRKACPKLNIIGR